MLLRRKMSRLTRITVKLVSGVFDTCSSSVCRFMIADAVLADLAGETAADVDRDDATAIEPDAARIEQRGDDVARRRGRLVAAPKPPPRPKSKMPRPSRKNSRFSGKNRLKRVRLTCCSSTLDLREVGVVGDVGGQVGGDADLGVDAGVADRGRWSPAARAAGPSRRARCVRLQLDVLLADGRSRPTSVAPSDTRLSPIGPPIAAGTWVR